MNASHCSSSCSRFRPHLRSRLLPAAARFFRRALTLAIISCAEAADPVPAGKSTPVEQVWVVFKTHLDIGYTDRIDDVLKKYRVTMMENALGVVEASRALPPEKRFSWTLAGWPLTQVLGPQQDPARRLRIEQAVREGAIAFHAIPFTFHTETDDLEDLVRGLGFSTRLASRYQRPLPISAKMTDVPCHAWVWPTLLSHAGVRFLQLGCNGVSAFVRVPDLFWWEGPDGSRILCHYTKDYGSGLKPPANWPSKNYLAMVMTGDNHGPPTADEVEALRQQAARDLPGVPVHFGTLDDFARAVLTENPTLPVIRADMPDTWIHGWLSMPIEAKLAHRARALEPAVDALDSLLRATGIQTAPLAPALAEAYEQSNLFSEHTFGPWGPNGGSWNSGTPRYLYGENWKSAHIHGAYRAYEEAFNDKRAFAHRTHDIVQRELSTRLQLLADSIKTSRSSVVVYNGLPWQRSGLIEVPHEPGRYFFAKDVPAGGYRTYPLARPRPSAKRTSTNAQLETPFFRAEFDLRRGGLASLIDRTSGRQLVDLASPYALGQFLHERFDHEQMLAFHQAYGREGYTWWKGDLPLGTQRAQLTPPTWNLTIEHQDVADVACLTATDTLGLAQGITLSFTFPRQLPYVEVQWQVAQKTPDPLPEGGWLCFPWAVEQPQFRLGRLGGAIDPAKDIVVGANRHYFCLNTGLTISSPDGHGIGLCPVDSPCVSLGEPGLWKFSLDETPKRPTVFVNLYNNEWNTNFPEWQDGSWSSVVRFWLTQRDEVGPSLTVPSWEARLPLLAATPSARGGSHPAAAAGVTVSRPGVLVTAFGPNPDGAGTLLRLWEQTGQSASCTVQWPAALRARQAQPVNLRGEPTGPAWTLRNQSLTVNLPAYAPLSWVLTP